MGLSFDDESSMEDSEESIGSLRFATDDPDPISENIIIDEKRRHGDSEIQLSSDLYIQMVEGGFTNRFIRRFLGFQFFRLLET